MDIEQVKTSKGIAIRFVFEDITIYGDLMNSLKVIADFMDRKIDGVDEIQEYDSKEIRELITLFENNFEAKDLRPVRKYFITVEPDQFKVVACQIISLLSLHLKWIDYLDVLQEAIKDLSNI